MPHPLISISQQSLIKFFPQQPALMNLGYMAQYASQLQQFPGMGMYVYPNRQLSTLQSQGNNNQISLMHQQPPPVNQDIKKQTSRQNSAYKSGKNFRDVNKCIPVEQSETAVNLSESV